MQTKETVSDNATFLNTLAAQIDADLEAIFQGNFIEANFYNTELKIRQFAFEAEGTALDRFAKQYNHILFELTDNNHSVLKYYLTRSPLRESLQDDLKWHLAVLKWVGTDMTFATFEEYVHRLIRRRELAPGNITTPIADIKHTIPVIRFVNDSIPNKLFTFLCRWFDNTDSTELENVLSGKPIKQKLTFKSNQNKFVDLFWRLCLVDPAALISTKQEITTWIVLNFKYQLPTGEIRDFNQDKVADIMAPASLKSHSDAMCKNPLNGLSDFLESL